MVDKLTTTWTGITVFGGRRFSGGALAPEIDFSSLEMTLFVLDGVGNSSEVIMEYNLDRMSWIWGKNSGPTDCPNCRVQA